MYYSVIVTDKNTGKEICQQAISGDSGVFQMQETAKWLIEKYGQTPDDVVVSVIEWTGSHYTVRYAELSVEG